MPTIFLLERVATLGALSLRLDRPWCSLGAGCRGQRRPCL